MDAKHEKTAPNGTVPAAVNLWITGLGTQYPPYLLGPEKMDNFAKKFYDVDNPR